jgi:hypothetical protein
MKMTDKDKLEKYKNQARNGLITGGMIDFLFDQAEKVELLERDIKLLQWHLDQAKGD